MREVTGFEHGLDNGGRVEDLAGFSGGDGEEAEGIGVEAVELAVIAETPDNGLGAREGNAGVLIG